MKINSKPLSYYQGIFVSFSYTPSSFSITAFTPDNGKENILSIRPKKQSRTLKIVFENKVGLQLFVKELMDEFIIDLDDEYLYFCNSNIQDPQVLHKGRGIFECEFYLSVEMRGNKKEIQLNSSPFFVSGSQEVEVIYTVIPVVNLETIKIYKLAIHNLTAGKKIVINSMKKSVLEDGKNKFSDCEMVSFPILQPGWNNVVISVPPEQAVVMCEYWPLYI